MIITAIHEVTGNDLNRKVWNSLAAFQNVAHTAAIIRNLHGLAKSHTKNAEKQATQLRYCLVQANEYFSASRSVSMATKPLLIYYGIMSLVLAEILLKQSGMSSLDAARGQHAHHGLDLRITANPSLLQDLPQSAGAIRAVPLITPKGRSGTFELWHRSAREASLAAPSTVAFKNSTAQESSEIILTASDDRMALVPEVGLSFLDCLRSHPRCEAVLRRHDIQPSYARVRAKATWTERNHGCAIDLNFQPGPQGTLEACYNLISFEADAVNRLRILDFQSGIGIRWEMNPDVGGLKAKFPSAIQYELGEFFFQTNLICLNELGILYFGTYLLGNYARYFPDQWMKDVEISSPLALAAKEFTDIAEERAPILCLSELDRTHYLIKP
jgi:hypothetical protein